MKTNKVFALIIILISFNAVTAQNTYVCSTSDPAPGNTPNEQALNTYWHYRYRLVKYFMTMGSGVGMSIPADDRNGGNNSTSPNGDMFWVDGGRLLGWYLAVLATEYKLLKTNGATQTELQETKTEMFYALHAVYRLDSIYVMDCYNNYLLGGASVSSNVCPGFVGSQTPANVVLPFPGYGIMPSDDINAISGGSYTNVSPCDHLNDGLKTFTNTVNQYNPVPNCFGNNVPVCEYSSGDVGPIDKEWGNDPANLTVVSKDNYMSLLMGLTMVINLVDESSQDPYGYNRTPQQMAKSLVTTIFHYIFDVSQLQLVGCDDQIIDANYTRRWSDYFFWPYAAALQSLAASLGINAPAPPASVYLSQPNVLAIYAASIPLGGANNTQAVIDYAWSLHSPCYEAGASTNCSITPFEIAEVAASEGTNPGSYSTVCDMISDIGTWNGTTCILGSCADNDGNAFVPITVNTGWDLYYGAINSVLFDSPCSAVNLCNIQALLYSAPYHGPYCHTADLIYYIDAGRAQTYPNQDFASCGWASSRRFANQFSADFGGDPGYPGNYNGLDYMLLFNLYNLLTTQQANTQVTVVQQSPYSIWPDVFPYSVNNSGNWSMYGTFNNQFTIVPFNCSQLEVRNLSVYANVPLQDGPDNYPIENGNLVIQGLENFYIDFNPGNGQLVDVYSGAKLDAYCTGQCCMATPGSYRYQPDEQNNYYLNPYRKNTEFDTINNENSIMNYPNPFQSQTTIKFFMSSDDIASIYITDLAGRKITDIISNQKLETGIHTIQYTGSNLASGIYLCVLQTRNNIKETKLIKTN